MKHVCCLLSVYIAPVKCIMITMVIMVLQMSLYAFQVHGWKGVLLCGNMVNFRTVYSIQLIYVCNDPSVVVCCSWMFVLILFATMNLFVQIHYCKSFSVEFLVLVSQHLNMLYLHLY